MQFKAREIHNPIKEKNPTINLNTKVFDLNQAALIIKAVIFIASNN